MLDGCLSGEQVEEYFYRFLSFFFIDWILKRSLMTGREKELKRRRKIRSFSCDSLVKRNMPLPWVIRFIDVRRWCHLLSEMCCSTSATIDRYARFTNVNTRSILSIFDNRLNLSHWHTPIRTICHRSTPKRSSVRALEVLKPNRRNTRVFNKRISSYTIVCWKPGNVHRSTIGIVPMKTISKHSIPNVSNNGSINTNASIRTINYYYSGSTPLVDGYWAKNNAIEIGKNISGWWRRPVTIRRISIDSSRNHPSKNESIPVSIRDWEVHNGTVGMVSTNRHLDWVPRHWWCYSIELNDQRCHEQEGENVGHAFNRFLSTKKTRSPCSVDWSSSLFLRLKIHLIRYFPMPRIENSRSSERADMSVENRS